MARGGLDSACLDPAYLSSAYLGSAYLGSAYLGRAGLGRRCVTLGHLRASDGRACFLHEAAHQPQALIKVPTPSTHTFTTSPGCRNSLRARPTPAGVPVRIRSPGCNVTRVERCAICSASVKIILLVWESCLITSLTHSLMPTFCGSAMVSAGTIHGPTGHASSKHF